jgi:hypothetical protein
LFSLAAVLAMVGSSASGALASPMQESNNRNQAQYYLAPECNPLLAARVIDIRQAKPPLAGLMALRIDAFGYNLWRPSGWRLSYLDPREDSMQYSVLTPDPRSSQTNYFLIEASDTGKVQTSDDLLAIANTFNERVQALPNVQVQWQARWRSANVIGFDARYTYSDGDALSMRWMRALYVGTRQYFLIAEASSPEEYDRMSPLFLAMMVTFRPDEQQDPEMLDMCAQ